MQWCIVECRGVSRDGGGLGGKGYRGGAGICAGFYVDVDLPQTHNL